MRRFIVLLLVASLNISMMAFIPGQAGRVVRVGFYENPPKIYTDSSGAEAGFWVELIQEIARKEGFRVFWVPGSWEENLARLESGEIDVLPDVGWTSERGDKISFSNETVLTSWARLYVPRGSNIETILDLEGKRVAGLEGALNFDGSEGIKALASEFGIQCTFIGLSSYEEVFIALQNGEADAGIANKDFGDLNESRFAIARTPVILQPTRLLFAFPKDGQMSAELIEIMDRNILEMKGDPSSVYYKAIEKYFGAGIQKTFLERIPPWVSQLLLAGGFAILLLLGATIIARRQINRQTAELRASEVRYRALLANNPDPIFRLDSNGVILDFHSTPDSVLHFKPEEYMGKKLSDLVIPDTAQEAKEKIGRTIAARSVQSFEIPMVVKGNTHDIEIRYVPSGSNEVIAIIRDITIRKQAENELRESEKRYQTLANVSPVGIFHTDNEGRTTYVNPAWCQITGLTAEEGQGLGWLKAVHPEDRDRLEKNWKKAAGKHALSITDYRFVHPDGTIVWVQGQAVPEMGANNQMVGFVGTVTDITERKKVESLQIAVARAESADRLKSAFLATMSHELRTPLNSIIGFTGILLQKLVGPLELEQEKQLSMIQTSARHLLELINDVLDISKIEAGQMVVAVEEFDIGVAVQKSIEKIRPLAEKKSLNLKVDVLPPVILINSDRRRVEQILINLLNNAVKFTDKGEVKLESSLEDGWVVTRVSDTGIGIKEEDKALLFKPFQQVDIGITRQYEGTGLGLSICQRLVELLGGKIWVDSEPGLGSTFTFTLPCIREGR